MSAVKENPTVEPLAEQLEKSGFRATPQRVHVYKTLRAKRDHQSNDQ